MDCFLKICAITCCFFGLAQSHGYLLVQFLQYNNHDSRGADGTYCDTILFFNSRESACDPRFQLIADRFNPGGSGMYNYLQPGWYSNQDVINFGSTFAEMPNPVPLAMNYDNNDGRVYITVKVVDKDTSADDLIDIFSATLEAVGTDVKQLTLISHPMGHTLTLRYWFTCNSHYYGPLCNTFCHEQNSPAVGHYTCDANGHKVCRSGWVNAATDCKTPHPCSSAATCQNAGTCVPDGESYTCRCAPDYSGRNCETFLDPCTHRNPCKNGATCELNSLRQPQCLCLPQFTGAHCDLDVDECSTGAPCSNGMPCINIHGGYYCKCTDAKFHGSHCELDRCNSTVCLNNGTCHVGDVDGVPRCRCMDGFIGEICENVDFCYDSPCQNGANCSNTPGGFACHCQPGFVGDRCESADLCYPSPCKNGATCRNTATGFACNCTLGFMGDRCKSVDSCYRSPCQNGATCRNTAAGFACDCPSGFHGARCELRLARSTTAKPVISERQIGGNPAGAAAEQAGISVAGVAVGCVIGFLLLAGFGVFLGVYLMRQRRLLAQSLSDDASSGSDGFSNAVYNNASFSGDTVRTHDASTFNAEDEVYEPIGGEPEEQPSLQPTAAEQENPEPAGEQPGQEPGDVQVNLAYEAEA